MAFFEDLFKGYTIVSEKFVESIGDYSKNVFPENYDKINVASGSVVSKGDTSKQSATTDMISCI